MYFIISCKMFVVFLKLLTKRLFLQWTLVENMSLQTYMWWRMRGPIQAREVVHQILSPTNLRQWSKFSSLPQRLHIFYCLQVLNIWLGSDVIRMEKALEHVYLFKVCSWSALPLLHWGTIWCKLFSFMLKRDVKLVFPILCIFLLVLNYFQMQKET